MPSIFNWSYFFIYIFSDLYISSRVILCVLKNNFPISLLIFVSLSFNSISLNSIKSFSIYKRLFCTFKNRLLSLFLKYFFVNTFIFMVRFPSLYILQNFLEIKKKHF